MKNSQGQVTGGSLSRTHSRKDGATDWGAVVRCFQTRTLSFCSWNWSGSLCILPVLCLLSQCQQLEMNKFTICIHHGNLYCQNRDQFLWQTLTYHYKEIHYRCCHYWKDACLKWENFIGTSLRNEIISDSPVKKIFFFLQKNEYSLQGIHYYSAA